MSGRKIMLVGEIVVDVTLQTIAAPTKVRMGGAFHTVRGVWVCGVDFELAYIAPAYLDDEIRKMAVAHHATRVTKIGSIAGTPNVMLIAEATEAGSQGYEHLLREHSNYSLECGKLAELVEDDVDVLVMSGNFELSSVLSVLSRTGARVHVDLGNGPSRLEDLASLGRPLSTLFLSTSASIFPSLAPGLPKSVQALVGEFAEKVILKENRGGARLFSRSGVSSVGSQRREIVHSVGVGDVFDVVYVALAPRFGEAAAALSYASWVAAEYPATTFPDDFKRGAERVLKLPPDDVLDLPSVSLPWEARPACQIYVAAPDFDYVDRRAIDRLVESLRYHNFSPRLPVRENGQANDAMAAGEKRRLYEADMNLLNMCGLLIAVNLYNDPGTLIEIGLASAKGIPVLVYDPDNRARNVMLTNVPELVSSSLDKIVTATFDIIAKKCSAS